MTEQLETDDRVHIIVDMYQGLFDGIDVYSNRNAAEERFRELTPQRVLEKYPEEPWNIDGFEFGEDVRLSIPRFCSDVEIKE